MRRRQRIVDSLEKLYAEAFSAAQDQEDSAEMERLDFEFQRDQLWFEVLLDLRDTLLTANQPDEEDEPSLLERAQKIRNLTRKIPRLK